MFKMNFTLEKASIIALTLSLAFAKVSLFLGIRQVNPLKNYKYVPIFLCSFFWTNMVLAENVGWTDYREVATIATIHNGGINVRLSPDLDGCVSQSGYGDRYASIYPDHKGLNLFQANLLAAMMSGKKVRLSFSDSNCTVREMMVSK